MTRIKKSESSSKISPAAAKSGPDHRFTGLDRRRFLTYLSLMAVTPPALAQSPVPVAVQKIHSFDIRVSDVNRSLKFYQDLFGAPVQARRGEQVMLRVGDGPHFFSLSPVAAGEQPGFSHIGLSVADFDVDRVRSQLENFGIRQASSPQRLEDRLALASTSWVKEYGATRELYFADREGIIYHLSSEAYCGGSGVLGETCSNAEAAPGPGMLRLVDYSHFTNFMGNRDRANDFYTRAFGKSYQAYQGPTSPVIGVGDGVQFLMYVGGDTPGTPEAPGRIDHVCFSVTNFDVETILAQLTDYGLSAREDPSDTQAMMHWISMRMPNRGGAEGGTPELYFSDPDGIRIQLQDTGYCGGTGYLGDDCPPL